MNIQENPEEIFHLYNVLKAKRGKKMFKLAIIDIGEIVKFSINNPDIYILKLPLPIPDYHDGYKGWNNKHWRSTELAKYVEALICKFIKNILDKDFTAS